MPATVSSTRTSESLSPPAGMFDDWGRRRSTPVLPLSATTFDSFRSPTGSRRASTLSPPPRSKSPSLTHDSLRHRLRSNSGLSLHTNDAALRQYTDYNQDGSVRFSQFDPVAWHGDSFIAAPTPTPGAGLRRSMGFHANGSATKLSIPDFFSREVVQMVLHNPTTSHRLRQFAQSRGSSENMEFLAKIEEYTKSVNQVISTIAAISTTFTSITATSPLKLPQPLSRSLNADVKHISRSILPGLEALFADAKAHVEQRVMKQIYPEFVKHQLSVCMKTSLSVHRATSTTFNFDYPGLGDAFCLTDPYKADNPIVYASDGFVSATGYSRAEIIPRNCRFLQGPLTDGAAVGRIREAIAQPAEKVELVLNYRKDGSPFWNLLYMCPLKGPNGKVRFFFGGQINVSETIGGHKDVLRILNGSGVALQRVDAEKQPGGSEAVSDGATRKSRKLERGSSIRGHSKVEAALSKAEKHQSLGFRNPFRKHHDHPFSSRPPSQQEAGLSSRVTGENTAGLEQTLTSRSMDQHLSLATQIDDFHAAYSRFMLLQFVPTTSYGEVQPVKGRHNGTARLKVAFCSLAILEALGLSPGAQEAVLYRDIFSVLSELAGSPSITSAFKSTIRERLCGGGSASLELQIPVSSFGGGGVSPGAGGGRKGSLITLGSRGGDGSNSSWASRRQSAHVERLTERRGAVDSGASTGQRMMSHWTSVKDAEGSVAWVVLVVSPTLGR